MQLTEWKAKGKEWWDLCIKVKSIECINTHLNTLDLIQGNQEKEIENYNEYSCSPPLITHSIAIYSLLDEKNNHFVQ